MAIIGFGGNGDFSQLGDYSNNSGNYSDGGGDPFSGITYGENLNGYNGLYGSTDFSSTGPNFDSSNWGYTPDFSGSSYGFNDFMGANDYGLSYDGSSFSPTASTSDTSSWPYEVSNTDFSSQDPWERLKSAAGNYNQMSSSPLAKAGKTLMGLTGNAIPGLGYLDLASHAITDPQGTAVGLGGALGQTALLGPIGGLMNLFGINLPKMAYDYANNSYMGEPRYGTLNSGPSFGGLGSQALGTLGEVGAGLGGIYGSFKGAQDSNRLAQSLSNMYTPKSPYAQQLRQELERKDAAAGRRSQVGTREVELQARLAQMANQVAPNQLAAQQQRYQNYARMANTIGGLAKLYPQISNGLSSLFSGSNSPTLDLGNIYGSGPSPSYGMNTGFLDSGVGNSGFDIGGW